MRINLVRKAAIGLAAVAGSMGLSMAVPMAAHAETATAVQSVVDTNAYGGASVDSSPLYTKKALIGVIAADQGDGCTQYTYFYSDGSKAVVYRCLIIVKA